MAWAPFSSTGGTRDAGSERGQQRQGADPGRELSLALTEEQADRARALARRILHEPFTKRVWSELAFFLLSSALAGVGLLFVSATMVTGLILAITFFGLAVLALSLRSARGIGGLERGLVRSMLGEVVEDPQPFAGRPGFLGWLQSCLRDRVAWRAVGYLALKVPWSLLGVFVAVSLWWDAFAGLTHPLFGRNGGGPGCRGPAQVFVPVPLLQRFRKRRLLPRHRHLRARRHLLLRGALGHARFRQRRPADDPQPARAGPHGHAGALARTGPDPNGRRLGRHAAPYRARPARRHPGPARRARHAPRHGQGEARGRSRARRPRPGARLVDAAHRGAKEAITELRDIARGIHPPALDIGLEGALATLAARSAVPTELSVDLGTRPTPAVEAIAYFCVAELLANVAQHAHASRASVSCTQQGTWLRLVVRDDGTGGAQLTTVGSSSSGLAGLTDRVHAVDGRLHLVSPPGGPTVVTVDLPLAS